MNKLQTEKKVEEKTDDLNSTSFEPETFDTWTVITDSNHALNTVKLDQQELTNDNDDTSNNNQTFHEMDGMDELSDGISIISESESAGRSSPLLSCILADIQNNDHENKETQYEPITPPSTPTKLCAKRSIEYKNVITQYESIPGLINRCDNCNARIPIRHTSNAPFLTDHNKRHLLVLFYIIVITIGIALIGKLSYADYEKTKETKLLQRVSDIELQNNLLRAEIDILSKKVNFLTIHHRMNNIQDKKKDSMKVSKPSTSEYKKNKEKIKVWPGNGKIQEIVVPRKALKIPYSCDELGPHLEGVCIGKQFTDDNNDKLYEENPNQDESTKETINNDINSNDDDDNTILSEVINKFMPLELSQIAQKYLNLYNDKKMERDWQDEDNRKDSTKNSNNIQKERKNSENFERMNNDKRKIENDEEKPTTKTDKKLINSSQQYENKENQNKFTDDDSGDGNSSDDVYYLNNSFNEKRIKKKSENIKKGINRRNAKQKKLLLDNEQDWHENMMKNREEYRKKNFERNTDNWYIDRGNGREEARVFSRSQRFKKMKKR